MEYNKYVYVLFRYFNHKWKFIRTYNNYRDAHEFVEKNKHKGIYDIETRWTHDWL